jgi:hypothetical protein
MDTIIDFYDTPATRGDDGTPWATDKFTTVATIAARDKNKILVHAATFGASRFEAVPVCTNRPFKWVARWISSDVFIISCKKCNRALEKGRVRWAN